MSTLIATLPPVLLALVTLVALLAIGTLVWIALPPRSAQARRDADIQRQIATLRKGADHSVATRPRVRANSCHSMPGHVKAAPVAPGMGNPLSAKPKACGGGICRHQADCSDLYCPGRLSASIAGTE